MVATMQEQINDTSQTFTADSLREALAQVRQVIGPDAVILGQERIGRRVSVRACMEMPIAPLAARADDQSAAVKAGPVHHSQSQNVQAPEPAASGLAAQLLELGYDQACIEDMPGRSDVAGFRKSLVSRLNFAQQHASKLTGYYRFVGAGGVGKTSTLIKVLVDWVMHHGPRDVAVISTDNDSLAGTESLQLACQLLNVPVRECKGGDLDEQLVKLSDRVLVLIDSPALDLHVPVRPIPGVRDVWVFSSLHAGVNLQAQRRAVQGLSLAGVVVTQLDQLAGADELANLLYRWRDPLLWLGTGSALPDAIDLASVETLGRHLFGFSNAINVEIAV